GSIAGWRIVAPSAPAGVFHHRMRLILAQCEAPVAGPCRTRRARRLADDRRADRAEQRQQLFAATSAKSLAHSCSLTPSRSAFSDARRRHARNTSLSRSNDHHGPGLTVGVIQW